MKIYLGSLGCILLLVFSSASSSIQGADETLRFAQSLQAEGEYYRAITEYKRALFLAPPESAAVRTGAILGIGGAFFSGAEYGLSAEWLLTHVMDLPAGVSRADGLRLMYRGLLADGAATRLLTVTHELGDFTPEARLYEALAQARLGNWHAARVLFDDLSNDERCGSTAAAFSAIARDAEHAGWKSRRAATALGIIPGVGYWYAGHRQTAVASLLVNAVFVGATIQAFRSDQALLGGFLSLFTVSWYAGNVYGSGLAARRCNASLQEEYWSRFEY